MKSAVTFEHIKDQTRELVNIHSHLHRHQYQTANVCVAVWIRLRAAWFVEQSVWWARVQFPRRARSTKTSVSPGLANWWQLVGRWGDHCRILQMLKLVGGKMAGVSTMLPLAQTTMRWFLEVRTGVLWISARYLRRQNKCSPHITFLTDPVITSHFVSLPSRTDAISKAEVYKMPRQKSTYKIVSQAYMTTMAVTWLINTHM